MSGTNQIETNEVESPFFKQETLEYMLDLLDKRSLIQMIIPSFSPGNRVFDDFVSKVSDDATFLKIFVFDLSYKVTESMLLDAFTKFGQIDSVNLMVDTGTNKSKGFGFIVFKELFSVLKALESDMFLDNRKVMMKYACAKANAPNSRKEEIKDAPQNEQGCKESRKIHVSGIPREWTNDDLSDFFKKYGQLDESFVCFEKGTRKSREFGFVTFSDKEAYDECLKEPVKTVGSGTLSCSKVTMALGHEEGRTKRSRFESSVDRDKRDDRHESRYESRRDDRYDDRYDDRSKRRDSYYDDRRDSRSGYDSGRNKSSSYSRTDYDPYESQPTADPYYRYDAYPYPPDYQNSQYSNYPTQPYDQPPHLPVSNYTPTDYPPAGSSSTNPYSYPYPPPSSSDPVPTGYENPYMPPVTY